MDEGWCFLFRQFQIPFKCYREAEIAYNTLSVDTEPLRGGVGKTLIKKGNVLHVSFTAKEARQLRVTVNSFMDFLILVINTMDRFDPA